MGNSSSQPIQQTAPAGQEYPTNGAQYAPRFENLVSLTSTAFASAWAVLRYVLRKGKELAMLPVSAVARLTPMSWGAWLEEKLSATRAMVQALRDRRQVGLARQEIEDLFQHIWEQRAVTEDIRARIAALPEAAQREYNRFYLEHAETDVVLVDELATEVYIHAEQTRAWRDRVRDSLVTGDQQQITVSCTIRHMVLAQASG